MNISSIALLFMFTITLHNMEEALWLPQWSHQVRKYHKPVERNEFHFALIVITALAYLISGIFMFFSNVIFIKYLFIGYVGAMILNVFFPHIIVSILLKRYMPGLLTSVLINLPLNSLIIYNMINNKIVNLSEVAVSTLVMAIILVISLPNLFKIGRMLSSYDKSEK